MTDESRAESTEARPASEDEAFAKALDLLALRPHFRAEMRSKLSRRHFAESAVESTLDKLTELGYLDDLASARAFASQSASRKGWGPRRLMAELSRRGVGEEHVQTVVEEAFAAGEGAPARAVAARWAARGGTDRDRLARYLDRRGFSKAVIVEILHEFAAEPSGAAWE